MEKQNINEDLEHNEESIENKELTEESEESLEQNEELTEEETDDNDTFTYTVDNNNINNDYNKYRYDDKKSYIYIFIGLAILILIIVLIIIFVNKPTSTSSSFTDIENKMVEAAKKYYEKNKELLPETENSTSVVAYEELVKRNLIKPISEMTKEKVSCSANVVVSKSGEEYVYFPSLDCGQTYKSLKLTDKIIESNIVTEGDGIYEINDEYIFRGEYPNNYVSFDGKTWKIIKINNDKTIKMILFGEKDVSVKWDDRYNSEYKTYSGINDFRVSRLLEYLNNSYEKNTYVSNKNKNLLVKRPWCIGKLSEKNMEYSNIELCYDTYDLYIGLLTADEMFIGSLAENCKNIYDRECTNYNYFSRFTSTWTLTASSSNTYNAFYLSSASVVSEMASYSNEIKPVININSNVLYKGGTGTKEDPYIIKK